MPWRTVTPHGCPLVAAVPSLQVPIGMVPPIITWVANMVRSYMVPACLICGAPYMRQAGTVPEHENSRTDVFLQFLLAVKGDEIGPDGSSMVLWHTVTPQGPGVVRQGSPPRRTDCKPLRWPAGKLDFSARNPYATLDKVRAPSTAWTVLEQDGPNHLDCNAPRLREHQVALITSSARNPCGTLDEGCPTKETNQRDVATLYTPPACHLFGRAHLVETPARWSVMILEYCGPDHLGL